MKKISSFILALSTKTHPFTGYLELTISQQSLPIALREEWPLWSPPLSLTGILAGLIMCRSWPSNHCCVSSYTMTMSCLEDTFAGLISNLWLLLFPRSFFARFTKPWMQMVCYRCHIAVRLSSQPSFTLYTVTSSEALCWILSIGKMDQLSW